MKMGQLVVRTTVDAAPCAVYAALTDPGALTAWFAEHADVRLSARRFAFWGRYTPQTEPGRQRLLLAETDRRLAFGWLLDETEGVVDITMRASDRNRTALSITQWGPPSWPADRASALDFWCLSAGNLANHVEGRDALVRHDFASPAQGRASAEIIIRASANRVFSALVVPAQLDKWIAASAAVSSRIGGRYDFGWGGDQGPERIVELTPARTLAYTWREAGRPETVVRWTLTPEAGGTRIVVGHDGFDGRTVDGYQIGWENFLIDLQRMLESGDDWHRTVWQVPAGCDGVDEPPVAPVAPVAPVVASVAGGGERTAGRRTVTRRIRRVPPALGTLRSG